MLKKFNFYAKRNISANTTATWLASTSLKRIQLTSVKQRLKISMVSFINMIVILSYINSNTIIFVESLT